MSKYNLLQAAEYGASNRNVVHRMVKFNQNLYLMAGFPVRCLNCSTVHHTGYCEFPSYWLLCYRCLVISLDGSGHSNPCAPVNTISGLRTDIFAQPLFEIYKIRIGHRAGDMFYLNSLSGQFEQFENHQKLSSAHTEGLFSFKSVEHHQILSYDASSFYRFSIVIAVFSGGQWRARFRVVTSTIHGLLVFKLRSTIAMQNGQVVFPDEFKSNTTLVLGIKPKTFAVKLDFRVHAGIGRSPYYTGSAVWQSDVSVIDDSINGETPKVVRFFDRQLYREPPQSLMPLRDRHA